MEKPLFWHQGLFLQPQHFQLFDRYVQSLAGASSPLIQPHFWGVSSMKLHDASLGNHSLQILDGVFVFPDGTVVSLPENCLLDPRSFSEGALDGGKPLTCYLGIHKWNSDGENVTILPDLGNVSHVTTRYVASTEPDEVVDFYQGGPEGQVRSMYYVLKLFWESEIDQLGDYELIPIAVLIRSGEEIKCSSRFFPPSVNISAVKPFKNLITEIRDQLTSRAHQLEAFKRARGIHAAEFGARDTIYLLALRSLNRYVPLLFHLTETPIVHPWNVFGIFRQIIGELSSFSESTNVLGELEDGSVLVPAYNHRDLFSCFSAAQKTLLHLLDEITAGPEYVFELVYDGTYFTTELQPAIFEGNNRFFLVLSTPDEQSSQLKNFTSIAKMGSRESLPILIARALPGIKSTQLESPPQELPKKMDSMYYQIDINSDLWQHVQRNRNIAIFWDTAPPEMKAELMIVTRR